jgi:hypothetical protein
MWDAVAKAGHLRRVDRVAAGKVFIAASERLRGAQDAKPVRQGQAATGAARRQRGSHALGVPRNDLDRIEIKPPPAG